MLQKIIRIIAWASLAFIVFATMSPIGLRPHLAGANVERFGAFALAGLLFGLAYPKRIWWVLVIILGSAIGLEIMQHLTPDRHGKPLDAIVKCLGGLFGIGWSLLLTWLVAAFGRSDHHAKALPQDAR